MILKLWISEFCWGNEDLEITVCKPGYVIILNMT